MDQDTPNTYLRDAVMTASPEQLQLMLYDGAIRFAGRGREAICAGDHEKSYEFLSRAQKIVLEMERGLRPEVAPELCERLSALYIFVYRRLIEACIDHRVEPLDDALGILRYERETWVLLLDKLVADRRASTPGGGDELALDAGGLSIEG